MTWNTTKLLAFADTKSEEAAAQADQVRVMSEEDARKSEANREERARMLEELQEEFGEVVASASKGDFSQRVKSEFNNESLNRLADGINTLVQEVDRGVSETARVLSALADADLTQRMNGSYHGAFDKLKRDTNRVADKLSDVIGQLKQTSGTLRTATSDILSGVVDLNERTTRQASTLEQTSNAMYQMSETVAENTAKAQNARNSARKAQSTADEALR